LIVAVAPQQAFADGHEYPEQLGLVQGPNAPRRGPYPARDQEDIAGVYKRLRHSDIRLLTLAEGEISELHVGLKGTMNALFLRDLADKTRRGQRGRVEAGKIPGGSSYGYRIIRRILTDGSVSTGERQLGCEGIVSKRPGSQR
jgi:hypothetical protein